MADTVPSEKAIAESLRLRSARPGAVRLSRGVLILVATVAGVGIAGAVTLGLTNRPARAQSTEAPTIGAPPPAGLAALPKDYAAPKLGPPLPGDLGRPMVAAQTAPAPNDPTAASAAQEARQRAQQEVDQARISRLFVADVHEAGQGAGRLDRLAPDLAPEAAGPDGVDRTTTSPDRLTSPASPFVIQAGAVIPATLVTGIRSDLPGEVIGQVTQNVFDSLTGRILLVPQGSKLLGVYDARMVAGQSRVQLAWTRLILPNGRSLVLEKLSASDAEGYGGLQDRVNHHWGAVAGAAVLSTILGIGAELGANNTDNAIISALRFGAASSLNQAGQQIVGKTLSLPPVLTVRPGAPVRVLVSKDLVLEPYQA